eukprot:sb/3473485/
MPSAIHHTVWLKKLRHFCTEYVQHPFSYSPLKFASLLCATHSAAVTAGSAVSHTAPDIGYWVCIPTLYTWYRRHLTLCLEPRVLSRAQGDTVGNSSYFSHISDTNKYCRAVNKASAPPCESRALRGCRISRDLYNSLSERANSDHVVHIT